MTKPALRAALAAVIAELERLDRSSRVAALARLVLDATAGGRSSRDQAIIDLYDRGLPADHVAREVGCNRQTVYAALRRNGATVRPRGHMPGRVTAATAGRIERMKALRDEGKTLAQIAAAEQISRERVRQILTRAGLETSEASRPLTADETAAVARYVAGDSLELVAASIGVSVCRVRTLLAKAGVEIRPARFRRAPKTLEMAARAAKLYADDGRTVREIAEELGLPNPAMIYRLLAIAGVARRRQRRLPARDEAA